MLLANMLNTLMCRCWLKWTILLLTGYSNDWRCANTTLLQIEWSISSRISVTTAVTTQPCVTSQRAETTGKLTHDLNHRVVFLTLMHLSLTDFRNPKMCYWTDKGRKKMHKIISHPIVLQQLDSTIIDLQSVFESEILQFFIFFCL